MYLISFLYNGCLRMFIWLTLFMDMRPLLLGEARLDYPCSIWEEAPFLAGPSFCKCLFFSFTAL